MIAFALGVTDCSCCSPPAAALTLLFFFFFLGQHFSIARFSFIRWMKSQWRTIARNYYKLKNQLLLYWHLVLFAFISRTLCNSNQFEIHRPLDLLNERVQHNVWDLFFFFSRTKRLFRMYRPKKINSYNLMWCNVISMKWNIQIFFDFSRNKMKIIFVSTISEHRNIHLSDAMLM